MSPNDCLFMKIFTTPELTSKTCASTGDFGLYRTLFFICSQFINVISHKVIRNDFCFKCFLSHRDLKLVVPKA